MRCNNCGVEVNSRGKRCPLCNNPLEGKVKSYAFPDIKRKKNTFLKVVLLISLIALLITGYIDFELNNKFTWSRIVLLALISNYITLYYITNSYKDVLLLLCRYGFVVIGIIFIWYYFIRLSFIPNIIIPALCLVELIFSDVVAFIMKRNHIRKYLSVLLSNIFLSFVPMMLVIFNITTIDILAHISILLSIVNLIALILFDYNDLKEEIIMIFNY